MKIQTIITSAAGVALLGIATWLITTTADGTKEMVSVEKDLDAIYSDIEDLEVKVETLRLDLREIRKSSHDHDKKGNIVR
jgi:hypothetical protein|tara:strand:+ start:21138 stop:21377 length:240 start_codon:yes stop_codon:yes gene_type:complete